MQDYSSPKSFHSSLTMKANKSKDTVSERMLRSALRKEGVTGYRLHWAKAPGFKGAITFELINGGEAPIVLFPGIRIAQLIISEGSSTVRYSGRYYYPTGPEFSRVYRDEEINILANNMDSK